MQGKWERQTGKYQSGENYVIGKICVGSASYASVSKNEPAKYRAFLELPGLKMSEGSTDFSTIEQAKARVERAVNTWFSWLSVNG